MFNEAANASFHSPKYIDFVYGAAPLSQTTFKHAHKITSSE